MRTRRTLYVLLAVLVSAVMLVPGRGAAQPGDAPLTYGDLTIVTFTVGDAGQLLLTGVLNGTTTQRTGAQTRVTQQTFTAPATLIDPGRTTDVVLLTIEPIALISWGVQIRLAQITLDIDDLPSELDVLVHLVNESS